MEHDFEVETEKGTEGASVFNGTRHQQVKVKSDPQPARAEVTAARFCMFGDGDW